MNKAFVLNIFDFIDREPSDIVIVDVGGKSLRNGNYHNDLAKGIEGKSEKHLKQIGETNKRVVGFCNTQLISGCSVADKNDKEEVAGDIPKHIVEICSVGVKQLLYY